MSPAVRSLVLLQGLAHEAQEYATEAMEDSEPDRDTCPRCGQPIETASGNRERWLQLSRSRPPTVSGVASTDPRGVSDPTFMEDLLLPGSEVKLLGWPGCVK
jgi:hypothetical protein